MEKEILKHYESEIIKAKKRALKLKQTKYEDYEPKYQPKFIKQKEYYKIKRRTPLMAEILSALLSINLITPLKSIRIIELINILAKKKGLKISLKNKKYYSLRQSVFNNIQIMEKEKLIEKISGIFEKDYKKLRITNRGYYYLIKKVNN